MQVTTGCAASKLERVAFVMPVLDDWASFLTLIGKIGELFDGNAIRIHIIAVDDGSSTAFVEDRASWSEFDCLCDVEVIHLAVNLGHQRAIAVGLSLVAGRDDIDTVVVMDSDGEDRPEDIATLLATTRRYPNHVVVAQRARRTEHRWFRVGYIFYKLLFRLLTGHVINFGNFCALPINMVRRLVHMPDLWNNLPAAIVRSRLQRVAVPTERGNRYAGHSRMNLPTLIIHGLSAMSVYSDLIFVRIMLMALFSGLVTTIGIAAVVSIRIWTALAIPGWATTVFGNLIIILIQTVVVVIATTLTVLSTRSQRQVIPIVDAPAFVSDRQLTALVILS